MAEGFRWGCDDVAEGSLHNSDNPAGAQVADDDNYRQLVTSLEAARAQGRERSRAAQEATVDGDGGAAAPMPDASASLEQTFAALTTFALRTATDGGPELRLYDATQNPDKLMMKYGYFVAEGFLIVQQLLQLPGFRVASILSSEPTLRKLVPDIVREDGRLRALPADVADAECGAGTPHSGEPAGTAPSSTPGCCCVYVCNRGDISRITGFKHSALATLAIVHRPRHVHAPVASWLPTLRPSAAPTLLVMDGVGKPDNIGALFRTALAFGVSGIVLSSGCADPLYRKAIRASMGGAFKIPYLHAPRWPAELAELQAAGYRVMALHLAGSVEHRHPDALVAGQPTAVLVGAEYEGVSDAAAEVADVRVRVRMAEAMGPTARGTEGVATENLDSLNVNVAAAIVLEHVFSRSQC